MTLKEIIIKYKNIRYENTDSQKEQAIRKKRQPEEITISKNSQSQRKSERKGYEKEPEKLRKMRMEWRSPTSVYHTIPHQYHTEPHQYHTDPHQYHTDPHQYHTDPHQYHTDPRQYLSTHYQYLFTQYQQPLPSTTHTGQTCNTLRLDNSPKLIIL
ncbi:hypothetical protein Pmani_035746 [Petrolisthes manimaculis]|uniref:Uncharacterized protein n=1 Tax=Petrolisthes manimaculis TaxID=1843537 RepID=A0AAE1TND3_9EUCA|nr:hypothetical protein Pmani_035746 [Petrolisthes manimaculis]